MIVDAEIISQTEIAGSVFRITLAYPDRWGSADPYMDVTPGQFINLYLRDQSMLLPRPISICRREKGKIELVYRVAGKGTKNLSGYKEGEWLRISTPLGNGYDLDAVFGTLSRFRSGQKTIALVAGGLGVPPMVQLAQTIRDRLACIHHKSIIDNEKGNIKLIAALGFREDLFLTEELGCICDELHIATEIGGNGFQGNVLDLLERKGIEADYYLSCGPKPMLKGLAGICSSLSLPLQVSLEERMGCGYGACVGCTCKIREIEDGITKVRQKKVCKDGPVFFGSEVAWDE